MLADGTDSVLKVSLPTARPARRPPRSPLWDGRGAVRLLCHDRERWALLLERCVPGTRLVHAGLASDDARAVAAASLTGLWSMTPAREEERPPASRPWPTCAPSGRAGPAPHGRAGAPFDAGLARLGASLLVDLPSSATRTVVVHGDFNPGNVLAAEREPWLAIDPKPMMGDPGYDPSPMVLQLEDGRLPVRDRFAHMADLVDEPLDRLLA